MIRDEKISLKRITKQEIGVLNDACAVYQEYLKQLCETENKSQHHIHHSINREYGYLLLSRVTRRNIPMVNTITIDVHLAFVATDGLDYYINTTQDTKGKNSAIRMLDEIFQELPYTKDAKQYSIVSEFNTTSNA